MSKKALGNYYGACNELVKAFCKKQDFTFDGWVADEVGEHASFESYWVFHCHDIVTDLELKAPKGLIKKWVEAACEHNEDKEYKDWKTINYKSYIKGARYEQINPT
jgi:hypothetical protein